jgi:hypothetical protein
MIDIYGGMDAETRIVVQQKTEEIQGLMKRTAGDIVEIGNRLIIVKTKLEHGQLGRWLDAEFGWGHDTARNFMNVAEHFGQNQKISGFGPSALYALSAPSTPEPARKEATKRAEAGETITHAKAKEIIAEHGPEPEDIFDTAAPEEGRTEKIAAGREWTENHIRLLKKEYDLPNGVLSYAGRKHIQLSLPPLTVSQAKVLCESLRGLIFKEQNHAWPEENKELPR